MPQIALTTFLKLTTKGTPQKVAEYSKYLTPGGGYDYYWSLKDAAAELTTNGRSAIECAALIKKSITRPAELEHNLAGLNALAAWVGAQQGTFFKAPTAVCWSPKKHLGIKLEPEVAIKMIDRTRAITLWNAKTPELTQGVAAIGIYLMQKYLPFSDLPNCECAMLDLRKKKLFVAAKLPANIASMVASEFAWVDQFFDAMKQAA